MIRKILYFFVVVIYFYISTDIKKIYLILQCYFDSLLAYRFAYKNTHSYVNYNVAYYLDLTDISLTNFLISHISYLCNLNKHSSRYLRCCTRRRARPCSWHARLKLKWIVCRVASRRRRVRFALADVNWIPDEMSFSPFLLSLASFDLYRIVVTDC